MATIKPWLDTRSVKKDQTYPVKIAIRHKNETDFLPTEISISKEQWTGKEVVGHPKAKDYNKAIRYKLIHAENVILLQSSAGNLSRLSVKELKALIENNGNETEPEPELEAKGYSVEAHFEIYIKQAIKKKTGDLYRETLNKIKAFRPGCTFDQVNVSWLKSFNTFLSSTCGINTRALHMRNLRAVFNDAINEDLVSQNIYPFRKFEIVTEKTFHDTLTIDELKTFRDYPVQPHQERYRDIAMLSFYLIGINLIDLVNLKEIKNGRIEYKREKTGQKYSIEVLPEAMEIISRYRGENYLLNILDTYKNYKDFASRLDENLKKIGKLEWVMNKAKDPKFKKKNKKKYIPLFPDLEYYTFRRTWATIADKKKIHINTISDCLGHEIGSKVTNLYINFDLKKVDKANRKVLKAIR